MGPGQPTDPLRRDASATRAGRRPYAMTVLAALCGLFVVYGTTMPFETVGEPVSIGEGWRQALDDASFRGSRTDRVANLLLLLPWGALVSARLARGGAGPWLSVGAAATTGAALSAAVETMQINLWSRVTSVSDLLNNTAGATIGGAIGWACVRWAWPAIGPRLRGGAASRPMTMLATVVALGWGAIALAPFVPSLDVGDLKQAVRSARPIPFGPTIAGERPAPEPWGRAVDVLSWTLIGGVVALAVRERGARGIELVAETIVLAIGVSASVELVQLVFPGHATDATSVVLAAAGAASASVAVALRPGLAARSWVVPALIAWGAATLIGATIPFEGFGPPRALRRWMFFPFYHYFWSPPTAALTNAAEQVASMAPLGFLLAARWRQSPRASAIVGWAVGAATEGIQLFNAERTPDFTDALLAAAGAWLGCSAWQAWEAARPTGTGSRR